MKAIIILNLRSDSVRASTAVAIKEELVNLLPEVLAEDDIALEQAQVEAHVAGYRPYQAMNYDRDVIVDILLIDKKIDLDTQACIAISHRIADRLDTAKESRAFVWVRQTMLD